MADGILGSRFDYFAAVNSALSALISYPGDGVDEQAKLVKRAFAFADEFERQWEQLSSTAQHKAALAMHGKKAPDIK